MPFSAPVTTRGAAGCGFHPPLGRAGPRSSALMLALPLPNHQPGGHAGGTPGCVVLVGDNGVGTVCSLASVVRWYRVGCSASAALWNGPRVHDAGCRLGAR